MIPTDEQVERVARAIYGSDVLASFDGMRVENAPIWEREAEEDKADYRRQAKAAIAALQPQDEWRPIETAPRDGTLCLFFAPGRNKAKYIERAKRQMTVVDAFSPQWVNGKYQLPENPYTHWRPLPDPPSTAKEPK